MTVPHYFQSSEAACGPACLRMLMAALGTSLEENQIGQHCALTPLGTTFHDLERAATTLGFQTELIGIYNEPDAIDVLSNKPSFVAMIDLASLYGLGPMFRWHFVVPLAMEHDQVRFHDPADGPDRRVASDDSLTAWATAGYRGLRIWTR